MTATMPPAPALVAFVVGDLDVQNSPCPGCKRYLQSAGYSRATIPPGAELHKAHGQVDGKPCPAYKASRRGTRPGELAARGERYINPIVSTNVAQSIDTTADVLGSSRGELVSAGHMLLIEALEPLDHLARARLVSALARVVDEQGTDDDWRIIVESRRALGEQGVLDVASKVAHVKRQARA